MKHVFNKIKKKKREKTIKQTFSERNLNASCPSLSWTHLQIASVLKDFSFFHFRNSFFQVISSPQGNAFSHKPAFPGSASG